MNNSSKKCAISLILVLAMCLLMLCGCGKSFDAASYVKGGLDVLYHGEVSDEYLKLVVESREECLEMYEENLQNEAKNFCELFYFYLGDEEPAEEIVQLYRDIFAKSKYEIGEAEEKNGGYAVEVTVYPIDLFRTSYEALDRHDREFTQRFSYGEFSEMAGSEIEQLYLNEVIGILRAGIDSLGYLDPVKVTVQLDADGDGVYTISDEDYAELHKNIIAY